MTAPVVFLGPTLANDEARAILPEASYRPPIARGDLPAAVAAGARVVGIIDGVFHQRFPVTPTEIKHALNQGVTVFGASSMGALRAAELWPVGMIGVGLVFEWYRRGDIRADHEVAVAFDPDTGRQLTDPLVNIRFAVRRLLDEQVIGERTAGELIRIAGETHYTHLRCAAVVSRLDDAYLPAGLDRVALTERLSAFNLKRDDAIACLEAMRTASSRIARVGRPSAQPANG